MKWLQLCAIMSVCTLCFYFKKILQVSTGPEPWTSDMPSNTNNRHPSEGWDTKQILILHRPSLGPVPGPV